MRLFIVIFALATSLFSQPLFTLYPDTDFPTAITDEGETLSVGGIMAAGDSLVLWFKSDRSVRFYDSTGELLSRIKLPSLGRGSYTGETAQLVGDSILFMNTIDGQIELYSRKQKKWQPAIPFPLSRSEMLLPESFSVVNGAIQFQFPDLSARSAEIPAPSPIELTPPFSTYSGSRSVSMGSKTYYLQMNADSVWIEMAP